MARWESGQPGELKAVKVTGSHSTQNTTFVLPYCERLTAEPARVGLDWGSELARLE